MSNINLTHIIQDHFLQHKDTHNQLFLELAALAGVEEGSLWEIDAKIRSRYSPLPQREALAWETDDEISASVRAYRQHGLIPEMRLEDFCGLSASQLSYAITFLLSMDDDEAMPPREDEKTLLWSPGIRDHMNSYIRLIYGIRDVLDAYYEASVLPADTHQNISWSLYEVENHLRGLHEFLDSPVTFEQSADRLPPPKEKGR